MPSCEVAQTTASRWGSGMREEPQERVDERRNRTDEGVCVEPLHGSPCHGVLSFLQLQT